MVEVMATMKKKRGKWWLPALPLLLLLLVSPAAGQELLNCLVASVDHIPVTAFDLEVLKILNCFRAGTLKLSRLKRG